MYCGGRRTPCNRRLRSSVTIWARESTLYAPSPARSLPSSYSPRAFPIIWGRLWMSFFRFFLSSASSSFNLTISISLLHRSFHLVFCIPLCIFPGTVEPLTNDHPHQRPSLSYDHISCDGQWFLFIYESLTSDHPSYTTTPMWFWGWSYKRGSTVLAHLTFFLTCALRPFS